MKSFHAVILMAVVSLSPAARAADPGDVGAPCKRSALGKVQELVTVTSDARPDTVYRLDAILDASGDVSGLLYSGSYLGDRCFGMKDIKKQALLVNVDGRDIVFLRALSDFDGTKGGTLELRFLYNGVTGAYRTSTITLERAGSWRVQKDSVPFNTMFFPKRVSLGITIGVNAPQFSWR
jgi:hypothetical protein